MMNTRNPRFCNFVTVARSPAKWEAPYVDMFEVNFDGTLKVNEAVCGTVAIIKDQLGYVIVACHSSITNVSCVDTVKA